jgi:DNA-binding MarR family transcriptional regulator
MGIEFYATKKEYTDRMVGDIQRKVFNVVWKKELIRSSQLVKATGIESGSVGKALRALEKKGWVIKESWGLYKLAKGVKK